MKNTYKPKPRQLNKNRTIAKRRQAEQRRKKYPHSLESIKYDTSVKKCIIPEFCGTHEYSDTNEHVFELEEQKKKRIEYLKSHYSGTYAGGQSRYGFVKRKQPWYVLTKGKCYNYEEREAKWGTYTRPFRVKSEQGTFHDKYLLPKLNKTSAAYMEAYVQDKLKKWEKKNPRPIPQGEDKNDLFTSQYIPDWEKKRDEALQHIRDFVVSVYDKLKLYTRHVKNGKFSHDELAAEIKDITKEGHDLTKMKDSSKLYKKAADIIDKKIDKDDTVVAGKLLNHRKDQERIILGRADRKPVHINGYYDKTGNWHSGKTKMTRKAA